MENQPRHPHQTGIDLRQYLSALLQHWWLILAAALLAAVGAYVFSRIQAETYSASVHVMLKKPPHVMEFDERIETRYDLTVSTNDLVTLYQAPLSN